MIAAALDKALKAVCPIDGVSIGREDDKKTWRIDFRDGATAEQRASAADVLAAFDPSGVQEPVKRDVLAELDEANAVIAVLVNKAVVTRAEIEAEKPQDARHP